MAIVKKYGLSLLLAGMIIACIGTYYGVGWDNSKRPSFKLVNIEGDAGAVSELSVVSNYNYLDEGTAEQSEQTGVSYSYNRYVRDQVTITPNGSTYGIKQPYITRRLLVSPYEGEEWKLFKAKYAAFARGKLNAGNFYADEHSVAYVALRVPMLHGAWKLDVFTGQPDTNHTDTFTVELPTSPDTTGWDVSDVQRTSNGQIAVMLGRTKKTAQTEYTREFVTLRIDASKRSIVSEQTITAEWAGNMTSNIQLINRLVNSPRKQPYYLFVYNENVMKETSADNQSPKHVIQHYYVYEVESGHLEPFPFTNETCSFANTVGSHMSCVKASNSVLTYQSFDLANGMKLDRSLKIDGSEWGP